MQVFQAVRIVRLENGRIAVGEGNITVRDINTERILPPHQGEHLSGRVT